MISPKQVVPQEFRSLGQIRMKPRPNRESNMNKRRIQDTKEPFQTQGTGVVSAVVTGWTVGDTLGRETHCMVAPSSVTYLEVIFFV